jgi:hypothetical protein
MAYSGISIQSKGGTAITAISDVQYLSTTGVQTLGVQIKPTQRKKELNMSSWQQALEDELDWALAIVQACDDTVLPKMKVVIRFNDLVSSDDPNLPQVDSEAWWNDQASITRALNYWQLVCLKFNRQDIFLFEILSEPVITDIPPRPVSPDRRKLEDFYQAALDIVRIYNNEAYFLLSPGPYGKFDKYLTGFIPFNIHDSIRPKKLMYGFHMYELHSYTHQGINNSHRPEMYPSGSYDYNDMNSDFAGIAAWSLQYNYPMYMGEFNAVRYSPNAQEWVRDVILNAKHYKINWSFFAFKPYWEGWNPYWDVYNSDEYAANWKIAEVVPTTPLWEFLLTQF